MCAILNLHEKKKTNKQKSLWKGKHGKQAHQFNATVDLIKQSHVMLRILIGNVSAKKAAFGIVPFYSVLILSACDLVLMEEKMMQVETALNECND